MFQGASVNSVGRRRTSGAAEIASRGRKIFPGTAS